MAKGSLRTTPSIERIPTSLRIASIPLACFDGPQSCVGSSRFQRESSKPRAYEGPGLLSQRTRPVVARAIVS